MGCLLIGYYYENRNYIINLGLYRIGMLTNKEQKMTLTLFELLGVISTIIFITSLIVGLKTDNENVELACNITSWTFLVPTAWTILYAVWLFIIFLYENGSKITFTLF